MNSSSPFPVLPVVLIVVASYLLGSMPSGLLISLSRGIDIRKHGSGNIGATNVWRIMGRTWGLLAFFCDAFKGWFAVIVGFWIAAHFPVTTRAVDPVSHAITSRISWFHQDNAGIAAALGCIIGHNFPVWLRFKGGKGVATSLGVIFGMMPLAALTIFAIWGIVFKVSRYVSLASITAAASLPVVVILLMTWYPRYAWGAVYGWGNFFFAAAATFLVIKRHTGNIRRLMDGTELRFGTPKPADPAVGATTPAVGAAGAARAEAVGDGGHRALDAKGSASVDPVATKAEPTQDTPPQI